MVALPACLPAGWGCSGKGARPPGELLIAPGGDTGSTGDLRESSSPSLFASQVEFVRLSVFSVSGGEDGLEEPPAPLAVSKYLNSLICENPSVLLR